MSTTVPAIESNPNMDNTDVRIAPAKQDKHALIHSEASQSAEKAPLKVPVVVNQELICGFDGFKFIVVTSAVFAIVVTAGMIVTILTGTDMMSPHGAVSTGAVVCSEVGTDILREGGHAVDAAVAAALCLGVVHGQYSGLGGGGFMLVGNPVENFVTGFDFREEAPAASTATMFVNNNQAAVKGGSSVAIPAELKGLEVAWKQYGKLPWARLVEPSIQLAESGFQVTPQLAADIAQADFSSASENLRLLYENKKENDTLQRPSFAKLLKQIASEGSSALYNGTIAQEILNAVTQNGSIMTMADLKNYEALTVTPLQSSFIQHQIISLPAPSAGPAVLAALNILSGYNLTVNDTSDPLTYHRMIEVLKFVEAMSRELGDPRQNASVGNFTTSLLSEDMADMIRDLINDSRTYPYQHYFQGDILQPLSATQATAHISVVDEHNNIVSLSSSINSRFGSQLMTSSGIILNNAMNSFNWEGKSQLENVTVPQVNTIAPNRRPQSNLAPLIAWNTRNLCVSRLSLGGANLGSVQSGVVEVALNVMSFNYSLIEAIETRSRVLPLLYENKVQIEDNISSTIQDELTALGHQLEVVAEGVDVVNIASEVKDQLSAHSDSRRLGAEASFF